MSESTKSETNHAMVKVRFCSPSGNTETLWARPIEADLYQLDNSPFLTYGISWQDIVEARAGDDQVLEYVRCVKKSGNRTLRVIFQEYKNSDPSADPILARLRKLGCSYEGMQPRLISINVPPRVDLGSVTNFLKQQRGLQWEYGDPTDEPTPGHPN